MSIMKNEDKEVKKQPAAAPQPRIRDYLLAIVQILWAWLKRHKKPVIIILVIFFVLGFGWKYWTDHHRNPNYTNAQLILRISREVGISGDANPAILTVVNREKVDQPFLKESKDGDKILLYYKSDKAVLYRPSANKVIKTGSFTPPNARIQVRTGTTNTKHVEEVKALLAKVAGTKISTQDSSVKTDYSQTVVVNVTDRYETEANATAKALNAQVRTIPQNESLPDADILVIVGAK
jgi:hypothetical protein